MPKYLHVAIYVGIGLIIGFLLGRTNFSTVVDNLPRSCTYQGRTYQHGEGFQDDCNSCSCQHGEVVCTAMACLPSN